MKKIHVINGANMNIMGHRNSNIYGSSTLKEIDEACINHGKSLGFDVACFQSNAESEILDIIHSTVVNSDCEGIIINTASFTHTSIAIYDALLCVKCPVIETHLSNLWNREESFRTTSYISRSSHGIIMGFGVKSYLLSLDAMSSLLSQNKQKHN